MKKSFIPTLLSLIIVVSCSYTQEIPDKENQIRSAVKAAPADMQDGATVLGFDGSGKLVTLKEGTNEMICISDDPSRNGFNVACYHKDLEPFMDRGRALRADGKTPGEIFDIREKEVQAGTLKMPPQPTTLHIVSGADGKYNPETDEVEKAFYRAVVYIPYATAESSGLPLSPESPGAPWLMDPGTHRAHIMITPPRKD